MLLSVSLIFGFMVFMPQKASAAEKDRSIDTESNIKVLGEKDGVLRYAGIEVKAINGNTITLGLSKWSRPNEGSWQTDKNNPLAGKFVLEFVNPELYSHIKSISANRVKFEKYQDAPSGSMWTVPIKDTMGSGAPGIVTNHDITITLDTDMSNIIKTDGSRDDRFAFRSGWVRKDGYLDRNGTSFGFIQPSNDRLQKDPDKISHSNLMSGKMVNRVYFNSATREIFSVHNFKSDLPFIEVGTNYRDKYAKTIYGNINWVPYIVEMIPPELVPLIDSENVILQRTDDLGRKDIGKQYLKTTISTDGRMSTANNEALNLGNGGIEELRSIRKAFDDSIFRVTTGQYTEFTVKYRLKDNISVSDLTELANKFNKSNTSLTFESWIETDLMNSAKAPTPFDNGDAPRQLLGSYTAAGLDLVDSDGDNLPDQIKIEIGTDPWNPDTDADGIPDGIEVKEGTNPLDVNSFQIKEGPTAKNLGQDKVIDPSAYVKVLGNVGKREYKNPLNPDEILGIGDGMSGIIVSVMKYEDGYHVDEKTKTIVDGQGNPVAPETYVSTNLDFQKWYDQEDFDLEILAKRLPSVIGDETKKVMLVGYSPDGQNPHIGDIITLKTLPKLVKDKPENGAYVKVTAEAGEGTFAQDNKTIDSLSFYVLQGYSPSSKEITTFIKDELGYDVKPLKNKELDQWIVTENLVDKDHYLPKEFKDDEVLKPIYKYSGDVISGKTEPNNPDPKKYFKLTLDPQEGTLNGAPYVWVKNGVKVNQQTLENNGVENPTPPEGKQFYKWEKLPITVTSDGIVKARYIDNVISTEKFGELDKDDSGRIIIPDGYVKIGFSIDKSEGKFKGEAGKDFLEVGSQYEKGYLVLKGTQSNAIKLPKASDIQLNIGYEFADKLYKALPDTITDAINRDIQMNKLPDIIKGGDRPSGYVAVKFVVPEDKAEIAGESTGSKTEVTYFVKPGVDITNNPAFDYGNLKVKIKSQDYVVNPADPWKTVPTGSFKEGDKDVTVNLNLMDSMAKKLTPEAVAMNIAKGEMPVAREGVNVSKLTISGTDEKGNTINVPAVARVTWKDEAQVKKLSQSVGDNKKATAVVTYTDGSSEDVEITINVKNRKSDSPQVSMSNSRGDKDKNGKTSITISSRNSSKNLKNGDKLLISYTLDGQKVEKEIALDSENQKDGVFSNGIFVWDAGDKIPNGTSVSVQLVRKDSDGTFLDPSDVDKYTVNVNKAYPEEVLLTVPTNLKEDGTAKKYSDAIKNAEKALRDELNKSPFTASQKIIDELARKLDKAIDDYNKADFTPPAEALIIPKHNGDIAVRVPGDEDLAQIEIKYTPAGSNEEKTIVVSKKDIDSNTLPDPFAKNDFGNLLIDKSKIKEGSSVKAVSSDNNGNKAPESVGTMAPLLVLPEKVKVEKLEALSDAEKQEVKDKIREANKDVKRK